MRIKVGGTAMLDFVIKYWVEFGFGPIVAGGGYLIKRYLKMREIEQNTERAKFYDKLKKDVFSKYDEVEKQSIEGDKQLQKQLTNLQKGILSLQRKQFITECQLLLEEDHTLTLDEYQQCIEDHDAYNKLGGNHNGDSLFHLVEEKAKQIPNK